MDVPNYTVAGSITERVERLRNADGYRREFVNGELTEYVYEDGEWNKLGEDDDDNVTVEVTAADDEPIQATIDLSTKIGTGKPKTVANAAFNNGILDVEFEYEETDKDEEA